MTGGVLARVATRFGVRSDRASWARYLTIGGLCAAQTFPSAFSTGFIPAVFRAQGLELKDFWVFSLLLIPVWMKWLWAPLIDTYGSRRFGRRKSWIVPATLVAAALYTSMALLPPSPSTVWTTIAMLIVIAFVMHTQDTAVDAYTLESLAPDERGVGTGVKTLFEALGDLVALAGLMAVYQAYGWAVAGPFAAVFLVLASLPAFVRRERPWSPDVGAPGGPRPSVLAFLRRRDAGWIGVALLIGGVANYALYPLAGALLVDLGFSFVQIGLLLGTIYSATYLAGSTIAAILISRIPLERLFVWIAGSALVAYLLSAAIVGSRPNTMLVAGLLLAGPVLVEACSHAAVTVSRMNWCSSRQAATDFAMQGTCYNLGRTAAAAIGGTLAHFLGWGGFLVCGGLLVAGACVLLAHAVRTSARLRAVDEEALVRAPVEPRASEAAS